MSHFEDDVYFLAYKDGSLVYNFPKDRNGESTWQDIERMLIDSPILDVVENSATPKTAPGDTMGVSPVRSIAEPAVEEPTPSDQPEINPSYRRNDLEEGRVLCEGQLWGNDFSLSLRILDREGS
ncbi:uncharacterized protein BDW43DRAFT_310570 [Aspergillus alliaceus]|uniref:uncharacterized protein n=1 Tax=Petromyces alliaceus TaxID=209559 RepID=UPI0012A5C191|nr:uncharacterized protein BDW43DRAFT_310570 [Aspergillus alliaceus]KAB8234216.1 hypothetical protein BDW43DRAFT_310570 [Aspergillus alliaceus]